jgi:hypothetical protein
VERGLEEEPILEVGLDVPSRVDCPFSPRSVPSH